MAIFGPVDAVAQRAPVLSLRAAAKYLADNGDPTPVSEEETQAQQQRWRGGLAWESEPCDTGDLYDDCSGLTTDGGTDKTLPDRTGGLTYVPFTIWTGVSCTAIGSPAQDFPGKVRRHLEAVTDYRLEREFWRGDLAQQVPNAGNAYLTDSNLDVITDTCVTPATGLALLEEALGATEGMIHAPRYVTTLWRSLYLIERDGNVLRTVNGTIVVPGTGYDGSDDTGSVSADARWAVATDLVAVRLSDIKVYPDDPAQAVDRTTNEIEYRAERFAAVTFDGCRQFGVPICATDIGGS